MEIEDIVITEPRLLSLWEIGPVHRAALEQFADLIAERAIAEALISVSHAVAEEREACAMVCEEVSAQAVNNSLQYQTGREMGATVCVNMIRKRSNKQ